MHVTEYNNLIHASYTPEKFMEHTRNFLFSHCFKPQKIKVFDHYSQTFRDMSVDCGRCRHCISRKTNEWVTRLYAHAESYKFVYFVTLTYNSVYSLDDPVSRYYIDYFKDACWHADDFNEKHVFCYRPCLLIKRHYQDFLKRLRKNTGVSFTYFMSGEYGHKFGSPHWHFIFFSNYRLTHDDINRAWSARVHFTSDGHLRRSRHESAESFYIRFGRTDFHDLVSNGSFNQKTPSNITNYQRSSLITNNAKNCFSYVAKYLCKRDFNDSRIKFFLNSFEITENKHYVESYKEHCTGSFKLVLDTPIFQHFLSLNVIDNKLFTKNLNFYETFNFCSCFFGNLNLPFTTNRAELLRAFKSTFSPFTCMSRGTPIGSLYFKNHMQDILAGKIDRPSLQIEGFVAPRYFIRKAKEFTYGFRCFSKGTKLPSFIKSNVTAIKSDFVAVINGDSSNFLHILRPDSIIDSSIFNSRYCYKDVSTGERILFRYRKNETEFSIFADYYVYNRKSRFYDFVRSTPFCNFVQNWLPKLQKSFEQHFKELDLKNYELSLLDKSYSHIDSCGVCVTDLMYSAYEDIESQYKHLQDLYHSKHVSLD